MTKCPINQNVIALFPIPQGNTVISKEVRLRNLKGNNSQPYSGIDKQITKDKSQNLSGEDG
ncbi:MAG: hypothetical protein PF448_00965 [Bacteroidales bacterium]|nr:hypothetical protein [Bacteroidales bacterium]